MAITRKYMEDALDEMVAYLAANFETMLDTVKTERSDTDTEAPEVVHRGVSTKNAFPKIEVLPSGTDHDYGDSSQPLVRPWLIHSMVLRITHVSANIALVENTLMRYSETINRLQEDDDTFGGAFNWVQFDEEDYSYIVENQENRQMRQILLIPLRCRTL